MPTWLEIIFEIIKIATPALIVFFTVLYVIREYNNKEYVLREQDIKRKQKENALAIRLQAYERMTVYLERINLGKLLFRVQEDKMNAHQLMVAMMLTVEQEFDHNVSQQIYMSPEVWEIIQIARNEATAILSNVMKEVRKDASAQDYIQALFRYLDQNPQIAMSQGQLAIKKEVQISL